MSSLCGENCEKCGFCDRCRGCGESCGNPFGSGCLSAEYIRAGGLEALQAFKAQLTAELNDLQIEGMPKVTELFALAGFYVNLAYPVPSGESVKLLKNDRVYLGAQLPCLFDDMSGRERCFGVVADTGFLLVAEYGDEGTDPEIVLLKRR